MLATLKRFFPWRKVGRWYKVFLESNGTTIKVTQSEIEEATLQQKKLYYPHDFNVVDCKCDVHNVEYEGTSVTEFYPCDLTFTPSGASFVTLPDPKCFDYMTVYVWAVRR